MKKLQILGTGCPKCKMLAEQTEKAAKELGIEYTLEKVTDINEIINFGVMTTPALAVDGEVKSAGRIPSVDEIKTILASTGDAKGQAKSGGCSCGSCGCQ
jgi:small redox-active disulfide protein 2